MAAHLLLQLGYAVGQLRHRGFVAFGKLFHTLRDGLTDAVHLAVDGRVKSGEPFVIDDQRLYIRFAQLGILGIGSSSRRSSAAFSSRFAFASSAQGEQANEECLRVVSGEDLAAKPGIYAE